MISRGLLGSLGIAAASALSLVFPWCLVQVIDVGIASRDAQAVAFWLCAGVAALVAAAILRYAGQSAISRRAHEIERERISRLFQKILRADLRSLPEIAQGEALGRILASAAAERQFYAMTHAEGAAILIASVGTFAALFTLSWQLAAISLALCPCFGLLLLWIRRRIRPAARREMEAHERLFQRIVDAFRALVPIRVHRAESKTQERIDAAARQGAESGYDLDRRLALQSPVFDILQALVIAAVFGFGANAVIEGSLSVGILLGFQVYLARLFGVMRSGAGIFGARQHYLEGKKRAGAIESIPDSPAIVFQTAEPPIVLQVSELSFAFDDRVLWDHESLALRAGEFHAILLPSGAGKTTLARCILGMYPVSHGTVAIPGGDVRHIGYVPQENILFDDTLRANVEIFSGAIPDDTYQIILETCALAALDATYRTQTVGENGGRLSGGEQRRVMLARALAGSPKLLIIDQMASELEPDLCRRIFDGIRRNYPDMGVLYLGHRMPEW